MSETWQQACPSCAVPLEPGASFCQVCGVAVAETTVPLHTQQQAHQHGPGVRAPHSPEPHLAAGVALGAGAPGGPGGGPPRSKQSMMPFAIAAIVLTVLVLIGGVLFFVVGGSDDDSANGDQASVTTDEDEDDEDDDDENEDDEDEDEGEADPGEGDGDTSTDPDPSSTDPAEPGAEPAATETTEPPPPPVTEPPAPVVTAPPVTAPPVTAPPVTAPPVTAPPVTAPPPPAASVTFAEADSFFRTYINTAIGRDYLSAWNMLSATDQADYSRGYDQFVDFWQSVTAADVLSVRQLRENPSVQTLVVDIAYVQADGDPTSFEVIEADINRRPDGSLQLLDYRFIRAT